MPDSSPARLPTPQALDEALTGLFRRLEARPIPPSLLALVDELEGASPGAVAAEARALAREA